MAEKAYVDHCESDDIASKTEERPQDLMATCAVMPRTFDTLKAEQSDRWNYDIDASHMLGPSNNGRRASDCELASPKTKRASMDQDETNRKRQNVWRCKAGQSIAINFGTLETCSTSDGGPAAKSDKMVRSDVQSSSRFECSAGVKFLASGSLGTSRSSLATQGMLPQSLMVPAGLSAAVMRASGESIPEDRHSKGPASNDECDTGILSSRVLSARRDLVHPSTTTPAGTASLSTEAFREVPGPPIGDGAAKQIEFRPRASISASACVLGSLVAGAGADGEDHAHQRAFVQTGCDSGGTLGRDAGFCGKNPDTGGSGEHETCHDGDSSNSGFSVFKAGGRVVDAHATCIGQEQTRDDAGAWPSEGGGSHGDSDAGSSEDEYFNPSVKTDRYGFFVTSERRRQDVPVEILRARRSKESKRADKWRTMIDHFDDWRGRKTRRFRNRVRKGVPDCVRGKVWQMMMGSTAMMEREPNKYADLLASDLPVEGPIEEDIPRTMYDHELFCRKSRVNGRDMLRRVLTAYGRYDREVQYCQGINYICSLFLLYMPEENAFWMLVATMDRPRAPLRELFLPGMIKAQEFQYVMDSLTKKHCEKLSNQLLANNLTPAMYATQWFLTVFTQRFPYDLVTRVWDMFLLEDWKVLYRVCLALFKSVEGEAATLDLENMNLLLRNVPPNVDASKILDIAARIPLKHRHIGKRVALFKNVNAKIVLPGMEN